MCIKTECRIKRVSEVVLEGIDSKVDSKILLHPTHTKPVFSRARLEHRIVSDSLFCCTFSEVSMLVCLIGPLSNYTRP